MSGGTQQKEVKMMYKALHDINIFLIVPKLLSVSGHRYSIGIL